MNNDRRRVRELIMEHIADRFECEPVGHACADVLAECIGLSSDTLEQADTIVDAYSAQIKIVIRENWGLICEARFRQLEPEGRA